jgi:hypothetical protein
MKVMMANSIRSKRSGHISHQVSFAGLVPVAHIFGQWQWR